MIVIFMDIMGVRTVLLRDIVKDIPSYFVVIGIISGCYVFTTVINCYVVTSRSRREIVCVLILSL